MPIVQTVLGPIRPGDLGRTYSHDHLLFRPPAPYDEGDPDLRLDSVEAAIKELEFFKAAGGQAIVEMTTRDLGRAPDKLQAISEASGVHILAATGYNKDKFCELFVTDKTIDDVTDEIVRDLMEGMNGTNIRAGVIKASSSKNGITKSEVKVFRAAVEAHRQTGAPISTHTEAGTYALEQCEIFLEAGVKPEQVIIGHLDRRLDWDYHQAIAQTGVFMGFDQISKEKYWPDAQRINFIKKLIQAGHGAQILLSGDWARKSYWPSYGFGHGPGLTYLLWRFVPWMLEEGLSRGDIDAMLVGNPARAFSWTD